MTKKSDRRVAVGAFALNVGGLVTRFKLYKIGDEADAPVFTNTHTCGSELMVVNRCKACCQVIRVTGTENSTDVKTSEDGGARTKPKGATEHKDVVCPLCQSQTGMDEVFHCGTCETIVESDTVVRRLAYESHTVEVTDDQVDQLAALMPPRGQMVPVAMSVASHVHRFLLDSAYQVEPERGYEAHFGLWRRFLLERHLALIVRFNLKGNFKIGALYVTSVTLDGEEQGIFLILHTLYSWDQIRLKPFDVPQPSDELLDQLHELTAPLRRVKVEEAIEHPQRRAFHELFEAADRSKVRLEMRGATFGELAAVAQQLAEALKPPKKPRKNG